MKYIVILLLFLTSCSSSNELYYGNGFYRTHVILKKSGKIILEEKHFESKEIIKSTGTYIIINDTLFVNYFEGNESRKINYLITDSCLKHINEKKCIFNKVKKRQF